MSELRVPNQIVSLYADFNASAPLCEDVRKHLLSRIKEGPFGNPNASHRLGVKISNGMEMSRSLIAEVLGAKSSQIIFNSGSSEGISQIFFSLLIDGPKKGRDLLITSQIEHSAILEACQYFAERGFRLEIIQPKQSGEIDLEAYNKIMEREGDKVALVSIMAANNETGVIQPYKEIGKKCQEKGALFFSDTTQFIGKTPFNFADSYMDFAVASGHKVGALTGVGCILAKDKSLIKPLIFGGGQEGGLRGGTQNYLGIESMAVAMESARRKAENLEIAGKQRELFESELLKLFPDLVIFGKDAPRLSTTSFLAHPKIPGAKLQMALEKEQVFITTSSACSDSKAASKVLKAMGYSDEVASGAARISLCCGAAANHPEPMGDYKKVFDILVSTFKNIL